MSRAKKQPAVLASNTLTPERSLRLCRLAKILATKVRTREYLLKKFQVDVRSLYRDIRQLRLLGVDVSVAQDQYRLGCDWEIASTLLPFPDAGLTVHEMQQLAQGSTPVHRKMQKLIVQFQNATSR